MIACLTALPFSLVAQDAPLGVARSVTQDAARDNTQDYAPKIKVGGQLYLAAYYDTYQSVDSRDGVSYSFPMAPKMEADRDYDLNAVGQFAMSPYQTRLNVEATGFRLLNAAARMYIETDFMGSSSNYYQMIRLRHAYLDLRWERDELLLGQTNNLEMPQETTSGVLTSGAGSPISILERPVMIRYGRRIGDAFKIYAAASYHHVKTGDAENRETFEATRNNGYPSVEARLQYGGERFLVGVAGGFKSVLPNLTTHRGRKNNTRNTSYSTTAFLRAQSRSGATLKLQGVYGTDLSHFGMAGGYGKLYYAEGTEREYYEYTNFIGLSGWIDLETPSYNGFRFGLFGGHMQSLGAENPIDPEALYAWCPDLHFTGRGSPRVTYTERNFMLGLEYSLYYTRWGKTFNSHYLPVASYDITMNHRILLLARYSF